MGGDRLTYDADVGLPAYNLAEAKIMISSTISDAKKGAHFMRCDLKDFFLASLMEKSEYMKGSGKIIPSRYYRAIKFEAASQLKIIYRRSDKHRYAWP